MLIAQQRSTTGTPGNIFTMNYEPEAGTEVIVRLGEPWVPGPHGSLKRRGRGILRPSPTNIGRYVSIRHVGGEVSGLDFSKWATGIWSFDKPCPCERTKLHIGLTMPEFSPLDVNEQPTTQ